MGTRSLTVFVEKDGKEIAVLYRQMDGYPTGQGADLLNNFEGFTFVNGIGAERSDIANGMTCLAAQVIARLKTEVGGFYLHPAKTRQAGEEFIYTLSHDEVDPSKIHLRVQAGYERDMREIYNGLLDDFDPKAVEAAGNESD